MEDNKLKKDLNDMNNSSYYYMCSECESLIEIIKIDEEFIEFKCNNNHNIKINIKDYLTKIQEYNNKILNNDKCLKHNEKNFSYCFECNMHLCKKCLNLGDHSYHYKINIIEIKPKNEKIDKLKSFIEKNKTKIEEISENKKSLEKEIKNILQENIKKIRDIKMKIKKKNKNNEKKN